MKKNIPMINCSPKKEFTFIENKTIDDPNLSINAKGTLLILLRNKQSGLPTNINILLGKSINTEAEIISAINELKKQGYLSEVK